MGRGSSSARGDNWHEQLPRLLKIKGEKRKREAPGSWNGDYGMDRATSPSIPSGADLGLLLTPSFSAQLRAKETEQRFPKLLLFLSGGRTTCL